MQEGQVTVEGQTHLLARPFHVLATANPIEYEGTYPLPEAQLDRFAMRIGFGYPDLDEEWDILARRIGRRQEDQQVAAVTDAAGLAAVQACVESVQVEQSVVVTRDPSHCHPPALQDHGRGLTAWALALMTIARAVAVIEGRDYVIPEDVKRVAAPVLAHRIGIKPELWLHKVSAVGIIEEILAVVPVPAEGRAGVRA